MKPDKMPYVIYFDLHFLIKKIDRSANNPENSLNRKNRKTYFLWIFNVSNLGIYSYRKQATLYREKYSMKKLCKFLKQHAKNIIDF